MSHKVFRFVPKIEEMGLSLAKRVISGLADRDRQIEDHLFANVWTAVKNSEQAPALLTVSETEPPHPTVDDLWVHDGAAALGGVKAIGKFNANISLSAGVHSDFGGTATRPWSTELLAGTSIENNAGIVTVNQFGYYMLIGHFFFQHPGAAAFWEAYCVVMDSGSGDPNYVGFEQSADWPTATTHVTVFTRTHFKALFPGAGLQVQAFCDDGTITGGTVSLQVIHLL